MDGKDLYISKTTCLILATEAGGNQEQLIFDIEPVKMRSELNHGDFEMTEDDLPFRIPQLHFKWKKKTPQTTADPFKGITKVVVWIKYVASCSFFTTDSNKY